MIDLTDLISAAPASVVIIPTLLVAGLGLPSLLGRPLGERAITRLVHLSMMAGLLAATIVLAGMLFTGDRHIAVELGDWVSIGSHGDAHFKAAPADQAFHFTFKFVFDRLSVPFAMLTFALCGVIGAFASRYLHREAGFNRFFVLFAIFVLGMIVTTLAGNMALLFTGWELVGVASALLVAYFHERRGPVENGLRVWSVYRISDAALLLAAVALHRLHGAGDFDAMLGTASWPDGYTLLTESQALLVGGLLVVAAAGKSALIPFSGWLPRAMEGPTPSSAIFYGALSVHLGAFLLLRVSPILQASVALSVIVVALGLSTALFAALTSRAQTDIKSALCFASLTQVGLIVAEIGMGLSYAPLVHLLGHACLRTLQFLRAPALLLDYHMLENAMGRRLSGAKRRPASAPSRRRSRLYRLAMNRGYFDVVLARYAARPVLRLLRGCDVLERRWTDFLNGGASRESDELTPLAGAVKELK